MSKKKKGVWRWRLLVICTSLLAVLVAADVGIGRNGQY